MSVEINGLPQWVWDLVMGIQRFEDEHPKFYRMGDYKDGVLQYEGATCAEGAGVYKVIPREIRDAAQAIYEYTRYAEKPDGEGES